MNKLPCPQTGPVHLLPAPSPLLDVKGGYCACKMTEAR
jgi:hypothetical protein